MDALAPPQRIGLIAGNGQFPILFADNAKRLGYQVSAIAHIGETAPELEAHVSSIHWVKVGQFTKVIRALRRDCVSHAVMLGGFHKTHVFRTVRPDLRALSLLSTLSNWNDDGILRAVADELEREGITILHSTFGLDHILVEEGVHTVRVPTKREWEDIRFGWDMAGHIGRLDIGQCVVVRKKTVVAVEAAEGTDATIRRGGELATTGAVVVKRCKPAQDVRFDLPAIGPKTIDTMERARAAVLAVEAGRAVWLDRDAMIQAANEHSIAIVGVSASDASPSRG